MKLKGKALLSLLLVLTLVMQLFSVSAFAAGSESLAYALYVQDEYGQTVAVADGDEALDYQSCSVTLGDWTALASYPNGVTLNQLMSDTLRVTPPEGFYVAQLWLYGGDSSNPVALPLTAADPSQGGNPRAVSVKSETFIGGLDYGTPYFNDALLSSWGDSYTLGVLLKRVAGGDVTIYNEYTGGTDYGSATTPGHPGDANGQAFAGWQLRYDNGATVLLSPNTWFQPYASCTLSAAYAPIITLTPRSVTVPEGTWISEVESSAVVDAYNLPSDLQLSYANAYVADAGDPLSPGAYSLRVGGFSVVDVKTGRELNDDARAVVRCEDGIVTVEAAQVIGEWVDPDAQSGQPDSGWVDPGYTEPEVIDLTPAATTVNVYVSDQGWTYTGTPDVVGNNCLTLDPWVDGANFSLTYTDAWGNTTDSIVNAGTYTLTATYTGGLDASQYNVNVVNTALVTIYARDLTVTASSDSKTWDGSALVNTDYSAAGLVDGHSVSDVQFSLADLYGNWLGEWPSAEGSYTKMVSGLHVVDGSGNDVSANYNIIPVEGTLTITAPAVTTVTASLADQALSYTGAAQTLDPSLVQLEPALGGASFSLQYIDANGNLLDSVTNAGTYSVQLSYNGGLGEGYSVSNGYVGTLTVAPVTVTVTAASDTKTWDGSPLVNNDYTVEGLLEGQRMREGDGVQFSLADANGNWLSEWPSAEGSYTKMVSGVHIVDANGNEVGGNYEIITHDGILTITAPAVTTVTASIADQTLAYTGAAQTLDPSLIQLEPAVEGASFTIRYQDANGTVLDAVTEAGTYSLQITYNGGLGDDYAVSLGSVGSLTVTAPELTTVTARLADQTLAYTGAAQTLDPSLVQLDPAVEGASFTIRYQDANGAVLESVTNAGTYSLQLAYAGGLDEHFYTVALGSVGSLTVTPAALTVTAESDSKTYDGQPLVNNNYSANGLLAGHSVESVQFTLTDANGSAVESAVSVGSYTKAISAVRIVDGNGNDVTANYSVTAESGTLNIAAAQLQTVTVTVPESSFVYDGTAHSFDASILSIEPVVEGIQLQVSILDANGQSLESVTDAGSYTLQASYVGGLDPNLYEVTVANSAALTVNPYELALTAESDSKTYDGQPLQNTLYTAAALLSGHHFRENDPVDFVVKDASGNTINGWPVEKGIYTKTASAVHVLDAENRDVSANYALKAVDGTLAISAPEIVNVTVTVSNQTWVYDGTAHAPKADEYTVTGLKDNDTLQVTLKAAQTNGAELESVTEVGNYVIKANVSGYDAQKYNVTVKAGALSVTPYPITITAGSATKTYDGKPLENAEYSVNPALLNGHKFRDDGGIRFKLLASNGAQLSAWPTAEGSYTKKIASVAIVDAAGNDVTKNYTLNLVDGTLSINAGVPSPRNFLDDNGNILQNPAFQYTKKSANGLRLRIDADAQLLSRVLVDNVQVPTNYYQVLTGSTIIILQPTYLDTLTSQQHVIRVEYSDNGYATTTFTVADAAPTVTSVTFYGKNDSKAWDNTAYDLTNAYINRFYNNASIQSIAFHLGQGGMTVGQAVNPGTYDIYLDRLILNPSTAGQQFNITVKDASGNTVATNYQNTSVKVGTLTITQTSKSSVKVSVQDQTWTYDGTAHTLNQSAYTVEGLQSGDPITVKLSIVDSQGRTLSAVTDAGTYSIKADVSGYDAGRYTVTTTGVGTLTVNPYKLTLTAESASKNYDGTVLRNSNVKATALLSGHKFRSGDGVKFSVYDSKGNLIQNGPVEVGTYTKKVTEIHVVDSNNVEVTANYDITRIDGTLTILSGTGSPKTGDQNHLGIWIALLALSAVLAAAVAFILLRRGRKGRKPQSRRPEQPDTRTRRTEPRDRK